MKIYFQYVSFELASWNELPEKMGSQRTTDTLIFG